MNDIEMRALVRIEIRGDIARVVIDNPPVNAQNHEVRVGLLDAARALAGRSDLTAVVLSGAGRHFVGGADLREMEVPPTEPQLPEVLDAIERSPVPWVAAIRGTALGGGLELALACRARVAAPDARLGLPEVTLGMMPGAGGSVRLPRLVPAELAVEMVTTGKQLDTEAALEAGLIDSVSDGDVEADAEALARNGALLPALTALPWREPEAEIDWEGRKAALARRWRGQRSPLEALEAIREGGTLPTEEALRRERARFLELRRSEEAAALRYVFFAERDSASALRGLTGRPVALSRCGVVGGGTMGAGIATALLLSGAEVVLAERDGASAERGRANVETLLQGSRKRGLLDDAGLAEALLRLTVSGDYAAQRDCTLVIEAVFEDMDVKRSVFAQLDAVLAADAVIGTNTSYLDVAALAAGTAHPERVVGLHFFAPAHVMKLLEVVRAPLTGDVALVTAGALAKRLRKVPVVSGVCDGFIGNRIMAAYRAECEAMLLEGASPFDVDAAMRGYGFAMGIFEVQDMSGLDIAWAMRKRRIAEGKATAGQSPLADKLCEMGRLGVKSGAGWYRYETGSRTPLADPEVMRIAEDISARQGIARRPISADEILARILAAMRGEGDAILAEGIARCAADIDVAMIVGYGFPRFRGGPMHSGRTER